DVDETEQAGDAVVPAVGSELSWHGKLLGTGLPSGIRRANAAGGGRMPDGSTRSRTSPHLLVSQSPKSSPTSIGQPNATPRPRRCPRSARASRTSCRPQGRESTKRSERRRILYAATGSNTASTTSKPRSHSPSNELRTSTSVPGLISAMSHLLRLSRTVFKSDCWSVSHTFPVGEPCVTDSASRFRGKEPRMSLQPDLFKRRTWRNIGPPRGGRVVAVAGDPVDKAVFWFGACGGGVWKTDDAGSYWRNVSDGFLHTQAVGALAVSEADPNVVYAGMGESCVRNNVIHGDGVYRTADGGRTWRHLGLDATRHIARVRVSPRDPDLV